MKSILAKILMLLLLEFLSEVLARYDEEKLLSELFDNYTSVARPALNDKDAVNVTLGLSLSQIINVDEKSQILIISAFIRQKWFNPILVWEASKYNNITAINVDPTMIWKPDIVLYNNADEDKTFGGNLDRLNTRAILQSSGVTQWLAPIILKSHCPMDIQHFPFDTQHCHLKFGSWTYDQARLNLLSESKEVDITKYSSNSEWLLVRATSKRTEEEYTCCPGIKFPDVTYTIVIARRSLFYLSNLIFPMTIIGMLTILSFLLPTESGERISLAITLLLAITVFMLVVADIIPATSDAIPLVGIFFAASMVEMMVMIIVLCYIMRLHHKSASDPPMSAWMRGFVLEWLSFKVRIRKCDDYNKTVDRSNACSRNSYNIKDRRSHVKQLSVANRVGINSKLRETIQQNTEITWNKNKTCVPLFSVSSDKSDDLIYNRNNFSNKCHDADILLQKVDILIGKLQDLDRESRIKAEWRLVAMTIDRCLLILFAVIFIATLFGCFLNAPRYVP